MVMTTLATRGENCPKSGKLQRSSSRRTASYGKVVFAQKHALTGHASVPSVRIVKGESPSLLAENCPPRDVIRKQRLKKPIPTTNILQHRRRREERDGKGV